MNSFTNFSIGALVIVLTMNVTAMQKEEPVVDFSQCMQELQCDDGFKQSITQAAHHEDLSPQQKLIHAIKNADHTLLPDLIVTPGADVDAMDEYGMTPLIYAVTEACIPRLMPVDFGPTINTLFAFNVSPNLPDVDGLTPVRHAALAGKVELIHLLRENGAEIDSLSAHIYSRQGK
jgi:ankyrin repeat protein